MVRVLVLGATGYIGLATCLALRRNSHIVYGLARTPEKAQELAKHEIIPVRGTVEDGAYVQAIDSNNIDVVIDVAQAMDGGWKVLEDVKKIGAERRQRRGKSTPKLGLIYTSGTWVHGSHSGHRLNDLNPAGLERDPGCPTQPPSLVAWRPKLENDILAAEDVLDVMIVRPALVYGRGGAVWSGLFEKLQQAANEKSASVELQSNSEAIVSLVHVDEVASALTVAAEQLSKVGSSSVYPVFDVVTSREPVRLILEAVAKAMKFEGQVKFVKPTDAYTVAMSTHASLDSTRLRDLLGWQAKRVFGMLDEIEVLVAAWQANRKA